MAAVSALLVHKVPFLGGQTVHGKDDPGPVKRKSHCFGSSNSFRGQQLLPIAGRLCHQRCMGQPWVADYVGFGRSYKLRRKSSAGGITCGMTSNSSPPDFNNPLTDNVGRQLKTLDSYFTKLHGDSREMIVSRLQDDSVGGREEQHRSTPGLIKADANKIKSELGSLESYFDQLSSSSDNSKIESKIDQKVLEASDRKSAKFLAKEDNDSGKVQIINDLAGRKSSKDVMSEDMSYVEIQEDESYFWLINFLAAIDIGVFLFQIASPVKDSNLEWLSLPVLYGAKINKLILDGEWWRLVTPIFLHSGVLHVGFSCWVLLTFAPQVCRAYGPFTFFLLYLLGGICATTISFINTPELTVSGTGPIFAIIGAWLVYQFQNKEEISKDASDNMYTKAMMATFLSFFLADSTQIDQWTHLAAAVSGVLYGFFTCPVMQLNDSTLENNQKEEGAAIAHQRQSNPFKSALTFLIFVMALCPLVYMSLPDLDISELESSIFLE